MKSKRRIQELDSLRGLAALAVVLFHYTTKYSEIFDTQLTTSVFNFKYGHYGVQLFFIISGFVIFMTVNKINSGAEFVFKRFIRLYPIFWVCMTITFVITTISSIPNFKRTGFDFLLNFTMIPKILGGNPIDGAYWSLIPELFFYALMLFIIINKIKSKIITIGYVWLFLIVISSIINLPSIVHLILNLKYGLLFLIGINFYYIYNNESKIINHIQIFLCLLVSFVIHDNIFPFFLIFFIGLFYLFVYQKLMFLAVKPLIVLGQISYALYLLHQFIGYIIQYNLINKMGVTNFWVLILLPLTIVIILSYFLTLYVEKPILKKSNILYNKYLKPVFMKV